MDFWQAFSLSLPPGSSPEPLTIPLIAPADYRCQRWVQWQIAGYCAHRATARVCATALAQAANQAAFPAIVELTEDLPETGSELRRYFFNLYLPDTAETNRWLRTAILPMVDRYPLGEPECWELAFPDYSQVASFFQTRFTQPPGLKRPSVVLLAHAGFEQKPPAPKWSPTPEPTVEWFEGTASWPSDQSVLTSRSQRT